MACDEPAPLEPDDICAIFEEKPRWHRASHQVEQEHGLPVAVQLAILHQESAFRASARPPRGRLFRFLPWRRPSSAFGYGQVVDGTWAAYEGDLGERARRDRFADVVRFLGWYADRIAERTGISEQDPYRLYLAYHEGPKGYLSGGYRSKPGLQAAARRVEDRSRRFAEQLESCSAPPPRRRWPLIALLAVAILVGFGLRLLPEQGR